ncbi:MAG: hypothetical protein KAT05_06490 [Spirochaetes bacterium]|nr:hypothetical protein [Spirochaetota bacterium]
MDKTVNNWKIFGYVIITWLVVSFVSKIIIEFDLGNPSDLLQVLSGMWVLSSFFMGSFLAYRLKKKREFGYGILMFMFVPIFIDLLGIIGFLLIFAYFGRGYYELEKLKILQMVDQ